MNGRLYDPELGRMLSPDPYVQVPEYSQNFNRYSYVLNNPLNLTDPTGFSFFGKIGSWLKTNWRTIVVIVVVIVLTVLNVPAPFVAAISAGLNTALHGGSLGDVAKSAAIAFIGSYVGQYGGGIASAAYNGAVTRAMGGKFEDGFISSLKSQVMNGAAKITGKYVSSHMSKANINGIGGVGDEEHQQLTQAGYDAHGMQTQNGVVDRDQLKLPNGFKFMKF